MSGAFGRRRATATGTLYHLQDPELLPLGLLLRATGRQVIYDVHEHYPKVVYARHWIPRPLRRPISVLVDLVERVAATWLSGVLGVVVDEQGERFGGKGSFEVVKNYPKAEWFEPNGHFQEDGHELIHVGSLSRDRGSEFILEVLRELKKTHPRARLHTLGPFQTASEEEAFRRKVKDYDLVDEVWCETESVPYEKLGDVIRRHRVGLIPGQATVKNLSPFVPTKLFEYLACGIPVVASALPSIEGFYAQGDWGVLADPADPVAHAKAIGYLLSHPTEASDKGARGRALVLEKFNWDVESRKLLAFYDRVLKTEE